MTFDAQEQSRQDGQPVELYDFAIGANVFSYTSAEFSITEGATTYEPAAIQRTSVKLGAETRADSLRVTMPSSIDPASQYIAIVPGQRGTLTIRRQHTTDGATPETLVIFKGVIRSVAFVNNGYTADLVVIPLTSGLGREAPRFTFQGLCNHILYDTGCTVNQSDFAYVGEVTAINGNTLTIDGANGQADGFYTGGFAQRGTTDFRLILSHTGNDVELLLPFPSSVLAEDITIFAGCDHTIATCKNKFDNILNYGGFAFVPLRNIFATGIQ